MCPATHTVWANFPKLCRLILVGSYANPRKNWDAVKTWNVETPWVCTILNACHISKSQGGLTANVKLHFCPYSWSHFFLRIGFATAWSLAMIICLIILLRLLKMSHLGHFLGDRDFSNLSLIMKCNCTRYSVDLLTMKYQYHRLWSDIIAMLSPFPHTPRLLQLF